MPAKIDIEKEQEKLANRSHKSTSQAQKYDEGGASAKSKRYYASSNLRIQSPTVGSASKKCKRSARTSSRSLSATEIASKCYDRKLVKRQKCTTTPVWQYGKYCKNECGSGIIPKKFNFLGSRKLWCKTPLSLYQATVGELGRKILCREEILTRDVRPAPPCNISHDILPPCGGYYRKYDCLRPCEEEYTELKNGRKTYRDKIQRYWEPCYSKGQKFHLNVNEYAPHNAVLMKKYRRYNVDGALDVPCW